MLALHHGDIRTALAAAAAAFSSHNSSTPPFGGGRREWRPAAFLRPVAARAGPSPRPLAVSVAAPPSVKDGEKPEICTADELHYAPVPGTEWRLALWRYRPPPERLSATIEDFQKQLDLIITYDWDFDNYLEEDVPAAMEYIRLQTQSKDGKLLAIGHSMGGILLYAMLSKCGMADPAQALNVPVVPLGVLLAAAYPLSSRPPYVLSWLNDQISAQDMMHPELFAKLVLNNFCKCSTVPAKVILQLTTAFRDGGLHNRTRTFFYKDHLCKCDVPILALAGDLDLICPPEAVYETVKLIPKEMVTYRVFGEPDGPHYAHYDLVGGRMAIKEVYPCILQFLSRHDDLPTPDSD
ncbi:hypothetical protein GW17_00035746 [Ensete ventricosum]|nr:hypothetical protein GW17_00035746 [Ensete ventricosum]